MCPWGCGLCSGCHTPNRIRRGFPTALHLQVCESNTPLLFSILAGPSLAFLKNLSPTDVMQLTPSFVLILGILFQITLNTYAIPLTREQRGVVTLPLKRAPMRQGLHPQKLFQMHNARGQRRLDRMTGRGVASANGLDRRALPKPHVAARGAAHFGFPLAKLGGNNDLSSASTGTISENNLAAVDTAGEGFSSVDLQAVENNTLTLAETPTTANSLGLDEQLNDVGYIATIQMGTPPRDFLLLMDSGSADLWVGAEGCQSVNGSGCGNHSFLGTQSSSSFADKQTQFQVTYGSGAVQGDIVTDNIAIAGLQLPGHTFGVANLETDDFATSDFDGIMGVAQSTLSQQNASTPVQSLADAGLIKQPIVSFKISRLADQKNDGEVTFGALDNSKFDQNTLVTLKNVNDQGFWEAAMDAASVNGVDLGFKGRSAILDTGTTLLVVPASDAQTIHNAIPGAQQSGNGSFTLPCTTNASLALTFANRAFAIDPRDIAFLPLDPNDPTGTCMSGISAGNVDGANVWLAGDVFLKNAYFSTNVQENAIQLAQLT